MSTTIEIEDIIDYILIHDLEFPGKHQFKYRNSLLRLNKQMMVAIWDELFLQIKQHMKENNKCTSIRIRNFGKFCYLPYNEISTEHIYKLYKYNVIIIQIIKHRTTNIHFRRNISLYIKTLSTN